MRLPFAIGAVVDGDEIDFSAVSQPKAEAEVALILADDLDGEQITLLDLIDATAYALPAIEVVGSRIAKWDINILDTIADNASSGMIVLGTRPVLLDDIDLRMCGMVMENKGEQVSVGAGVACLGNPLNAAVWLARKMVDVGMPLSAGDVIVEVAQEAVSSAADIKKRVDQLKKDGKKSVLLLVSNGDGELRFVALGVQ